MTATYKERVLRYRIMRHDELPEAHKAAYRERGIDPDDNWSLIWSFGNKADAEARLAHEQADAARWETWKLVDAGKETVIERVMW